ncbi:hypothetical protein GBF38_022946 [Nibea albiflora]|uniref:Uncharacterized protein n=1 Tax=Nibea albiflora TaxID=240163 RepID=A0ACB7EY85_NIBAL|nr:hypothetical protein GBF38_022946 [Nibea albiflora]
MPQPTQHSLIHVLLLWITILSIIQAVFIIFFFTGHRGLQSTPDLKLPMGKILSYKACEDKGSYKWEALNPIESLVSASGKDLQIKKDGYYFLILQVTLKGCTCSYNTTNQTYTDCTVKVDWKRETLLQGWINKNTCSTGLLGTAAGLFAGGKLEFELPKTGIDDQKHLTHLDIIYMHEP